MKRPSLHMMIDSSSSSGSSDDELGSSLKRVRISTSPGELRLDRDLTELRIGWGSSSGSSTSRRRIGRRFYNETTELVLDRPESLGLMFSIKRPYYTLRLKISMTRMYPHTPPKIVFTDQQQASPEYDSYIINESILQHAISTTNKNVNEWWTPIKTVSDFLQNTLERFMVILPPTTYDANDENMSNITNNYHSNDNMMDHDGGESGLPKKINLRFPPNRFDIGYDTTNANKFGTTRPMEC